MFIVDSQFDDQAFKEVANDYVQKMFTSLDPEDYFGYISLGGGKGQELIIEQKKQKPNVKL